MTKKTIKIQVFEMQFDWKVAVLVVIAFCLLLSLGVWQLFRAEEKRQLNSELERRQQAMPVPFENLPSANGETLTGRKVSLQGRYLNDQSIVIANQFFRGQRGFEVLTPFQLNTTGQLVLISRGWLAAMPGGDDSLNIPLVAGDQQLSAQVFVPPQKSFFIDERIDAKQWPLHLHHFDFVTVMTIFDQQLSPVILRLDENTAGVLTRHWRSKRLRPDTNTSYAIQWFGMALLLLLAVLIASSNVVQLLHTKFNKF